MNTIKHTVSAVRGIALGLVFGALALVALSQPPAVEVVPQPTPEERRIAALIERYDCSVRGYDDGTVPAHAILRVNGEVRVVSFDRGWAAVEGDAPGEVVAFCRG